MAIAMSGTDLLEMIVGGWAALEPALAQAPVLALRLRDVGQGLPDVAPQLHVNEPLESPECLAAAT